MEMPDLAPSVPSRIVTIDAVTLGEAAPSAGRITFSLPVQLRVISTGQIVRPSSVTVTLVNGRTQVRLPVYTSALQDDLGGSWVVVVKPSWSPEPHTIRVPAGTGPIPLGSIAPARPLTVRERDYAISSVSVNVTPGTAGGSGSVAGGVLSLNLRYPSGGYWRGQLANGVSPNSLTHTSDGGMWGIASSTTHPDLPFTGQGALLNNPSGYANISQTAWQYGEVGHWTRQRINSYSTPQQWSAWEPSGVVRTQLITEGTNLDDLRINGDWTINTVAIAESLTGWPDNIDPTAAHLQSRATSGGTTFHMLHVSGMDGAVLTRQTTITAPRPWSPWKRLT